ncbi:16S rRNA (uracil(1498)-N(3))-methyltransferase [Leptospira sp. FAT2]|uniref:16S rRNA (uracil(1498)-N(3))-methyltransferase n=1 Tax=Leptospira sanjuanensis TaxID=2879643 RepID=UPI001EE97647|nr:RsmE family RNA methyltransferase [Leptospira sanjuanensis]MCG6167842.1 16S rRNA (uracil(1498)-N(3))-methyltransferase [Leptospira sanjuanensis]MCG6193259.1 16S rRNA (uracil(1498)-N(3))-methyltransferase [Leptospira sanjuanensis]
MNLLICKEEWRIGNSNRFSINDPQRTEHIFKILNKRSGDRLKTGLLDKSLGLLKIEEIGPKALTGTYKPILIPKPRFPEVHLLIAVNRPPTVRKILQLAGTWGVATIRFFLSKNARKEYRTSPIWNRNEIESELVEGMEQGKNIFLPKVRWDFEKRADAVLEETLSAESGFGLRWILDRKGDSPSRIIREKKSHAEFRMDSPLKILAAIGPESGFIKSEIDFWKEKGFQTLHLSSRVLRTETAVAFLLARLEESELFLER